MDPSSSPIAQFYDRKSILITGASGFIGKVLLEKLLRCLTGIETIYVLIRPKRGTDPASRCAAMLNQAPFTIHPETQNARAKVVPISGDTSKANLGLSSSDHELLVNRVNIVFHLAASINFDAGLRYHLNHNANGTENMLRFCESVKNLNAFVYVGTAYSNCHLKVIEEKIVPISSQDARRLLSQFNTISDTEAEALYQSLAAGRPNSYTFTKALSENLVAQYESKFPIAIVRPSITTNAIAEPCPGWIDSHAALMEFVMLLSVGALRIAPGSDHIHLAIIPVDVCANSIIAAAWHLARTESPSKVTIFNVATCHVNGAPSWDQFLNEIYEHIEEAPPSQAIRPPVARSKCLTQSWVRFTYAKLISHLLVAMCLDVVMMCMGRKPFLRKLAHKINKGITLIWPIATREWDFQQDNTAKLYETMSESDQKQFDLYTTTRLDHKQYMSNFYYGMRRHLLNDPDETIPYARKRMAKIKAAWRAIDLFTWLLLAYFGYVTIVTLIGYAN